jgi:hypothetical protein
MNGLPGDRIEYDAARGGEYWKKKFNTRKATGSAEMTCLDRRRKRGKLGTGRNKSWSCSIKISYCAANPPRRVNLNSNVVAFYVCAMHGFFCLTSIVLTPKLDYSCVCTELSVSADRSQWSKRAKDIIKL